MPQEKAKRTIGIRKHKKILTKKQRGFVKDYVESGVGTTAALKNYNVKSREDAQVIASQNLDIPIIIEAIDKEQKRLADRISDDLLEEVHNNLLNATRLDHMVFPLGPKTDLECEDEGDISDEEITRLLKSVNCIVRRIAHGETGRHVYFWASDNRAKKDGLEMGYRLKGAYAPEKSIVLNFNGEQRNKTKEQIRGYLEDNR